jgi:hypothetical protein
MGWAGSLIATMKTGFRTERVFASPDALVRAAVAVVAAAATGWVLGDVLAATFMGVGAFIVSMSTLLPRVRNRATNALVVAVLFPASALIGVYVQPWGWWTLLPIAVFAFDAGVVWSLGPAPGARSVLIVIGLLVTGDTSPSTTTGLALVGWIASGAGLVLLVQLLPPYGPRHHGQRVRLAALYRSLAGWSRSGAAEYLATEPFAAARSGLALLPRSARPAAASLYGLFGEAERIRRVLATTPDVPYDTVAAVLEHLAVGLPRRRPRPLPEGLRRRLDAAPKAIREPLSEAVRLAGAHVRVLGGRREHRTGEVAPHNEVAGLYAAATGSSLRTLRGVFRPGSPMLRHATRIALGAVAGEAAGRALGNFWGHGLPEHGFWAALTAMLVLFPDYEHTFARAWSRPTGAIAGALIGWALLQLPLSGGAEVIIGVVFAVVAFTLLRTGQHWLGLGVTPWLVLLLHHVGTPTDNIAYGRVADTALGALIAMAVFLVLPTWHHHRAPVLLGRWLEAQSRFLPMLLIDWAERGAMPAADLERLREDSRARRHELQDALTQLSREPYGQRGRFTYAQLPGLRTAVAELARCTTRLVALAPRSDATLVPELTAFAQPLRDGLERLAAASVGEAPVRAGELRAAFDRVAPVSSSRAPAVDAWLRTVSAVEAIADLLETPPASRSVQPTGMTGVSERTATCNANST